MTVPRQKKSAQVVAEKAPQNLNPDKLDTAVARQLKKLQTESPPEKAQPPPDANRLKLVWRLWHLLPKDWPTENRIDLLLTPAADIKKVRQRQVQNDRWLLSKPKIKFRPSSAGKAFWSAFAGQFNASDAGTFDAARWWDWFLGQFQKCFAFTRQKDGTRLYTRQTYIEQQLVFRDFQLHNAGDIATYRTAMELQIADPKFWEISAPSLELILKARRRWEAYEAARLKAAGLFGELITSNSFAAEPFDEIEQHPQFLDRQKLVDYLAGDFWKIGLYDQEFFIEDTFQSLLQPRRQRYEDFADHVACDTISADTLRNFMGQDFLKLTQQQMLHFVRLCAPRHPRRKMEEYLILKVWLTDNAPVFQEFRWGLLGVFDRVVKLFRHYPGDKLEGGNLATFKNALCDWHIVLNLAKGRSPDIRFSGQHSELLTAPPFFVFKQS